MERRRGGSGRNEGAGKIMTMRIGFHLTPFWSPTDRRPTQIIDEAIEVVSAASRMGYAWVSIGHHVLSHPTVWPQPYPMLARLAPETGGLRLKASMLLLPLGDAGEWASRSAIAKKSSSPSGSPARTACRSSRSRSP